MIYVSSIYHFNNKTFQLFEFEKYYFIRKLEKGVDFRNIQPRQKEF